MPGERSGSLAATQAPSSRPTTLSTSSARYFFRWELPKVAPMLDLLASADTTTLEMQDAWF